MRKWRNIKTLEMGKFDYIFFWKGKRLLIGHRLLSWKGTADYWKPSRFIKNTFIIFSIQHSNFVKLRICSNDLEREIESKIPVFFSTYSWAAVGIIKGWNQSKTRPVEREKRKQIYKENMWQLSQHICEIDIIYIESWEDWVLQGIIKLYWVIQLVMEKLIQIYILLTSNPGWVWTSST